MRKKREAGECEYGGCHVHSGASRRCREHAREFAARMKSYRLTAKLGSISCACGLTLAVEGGSPVCPYYKSGEHVFPMGRKRMPEGVAT